VAFFSNLQVGFNKKTLDLTQGGSVSDSPERCGPPSGADRCQKKNAIFWGSLTKPVAGCTARTDLKRLYEDRSGTSHSN